MKIKYLKKLILECINEVIEETTYEVKPEDVDKIKSRVDKEEDTIKIVKEEELEEMARIAQPYRLADNWEETLNSSPDNVKNNRWIKGIIEYLQEVGEATTINIARDKFNTRQQQINPLMKPLVDLGILTQGDKPAPTSNAFLRQLANPNKVKKANDDYNGMVFGGGEYGSDDEDEVIDDEVIDIDSEESSIETPSLDPINNDDDADLPPSNQYADELSDAVGELAALTKTKDDLIRKWKSQQITIGDYKAQISGIPERIKELERIINPPLDDDEDDDLVNEQLKLRWQKIAGIK
jgi:hypothetical protein